MKYLILLFLFSTPALACNNFIAESEIADAMALKPGAGVKVCGDKDPCVCFDGVDWETAAYGEYEVDVPNFESVPVFDESGEPVLGEDGEPEMKDVERGTKKEKRFGFHVDENKRKSRDDKKVAEKEKEKTAKDAIKAIKAKLDADTAPTAAEQRKILKFLLEKFGE